MVHDHGYTYEFIRRGVTFYTSEEYLRRGDEWVKINKPADAMVGTFADQLLLLSCARIGRCTEDLCCGLVAGHTVGAVSARGKSSFAALFTPTARTSLAGRGETKHYLLLNELDNVRNGSTC